MSTTHENTNKLLDFIALKFQNDKLNNDSLVQIIELCSSYLNLQTVSDYARKNAMTYNGVIKPVKSRQIITLLGVKFVVDNH
jgi:hypothetical protein